MSTVALVTCQARPALNTTALLRISLAHLGCSSVEVAWDDPAFDWSQCHAVVPRTVQDYPERLPEFHAWLRRTPSLVTPGPTLAWNLHRHYLRDLEAKGVPIVPTVWLARGSPTPDVGALLEAEGWAQAVLKPAVAVGSRRTLRFGREGGERVVKAFEALLLRGDVVVQEYLPAVETTQERSLVFLDGAYSHAVRREPQLETGRHVGTIAKADDDELWVARQALSAIDGPPLYAQVDLVRDAQGYARLLELELVMPDLFLGEHPFALDTFARAIVRTAKAFEAR